MPLDCPTAPASLAPLLAALLVASSPLLHLLQDHFIPMLTEPGAGLRDRHCLFSRSMEAVIRQCSTMVAREKAVSYRRSQLGAFASSLRGEKIHAAGTTNTSDRLGFWQQRNGCTSNSTVDSDNGNVHHTSWVCSGQNGTLQHWKVDKNGMYIW